MPEPPRIWKRQLREYRTAAGHSPVSDFIDQLSDVDAALIVAALKIVQRDGISSRLVRHVRGAIYEIRVEGLDQTFRILFAPQGRFQQVFLELEGFSKKTQKTPPTRIETAEQRLRDWQQRGLIRRFWGR